MKPRVSTQLSCKVPILVCALLNLCAMCPADTVVSVTDSVLPFNQGSLFLGGQYSNVVAVSWTQTTSVSNVTIAASLQSTSAGFRTGTAYLMNAIGPAATAANEVVPPASFTAATPYLSDPIPLTVLFTGLNLAPGTYYLVLSAPSSQTTSGSPLTWQFTPSPVITKAPTVTQGNTFTANTVFNTVNSFAPASTFGVSSLPPIFDVFVGSQVIFLGVDTVTKGNWTGRYGSGGYVIPNDVATQLDHANLSVSQSFNYTWAGLTSDPRALLKSPGATSGIASAFVNYYGQSFSINLNIYDNKPHTVSFYLLDWDSTSRSETITITDASTGQVYDTRTFSGFHNGEYAVWQLKGNLTIKVTPNSGAGAAVSGIFVE